MRMISVYLVVRLVAGGYAAFDSIRAWLVSRTGF